MKKVGDDKWREPTVKMRGQKYACLRSWNSTHPVVDSRAGRRVTPKPDLDDIERRIR